jgi:2,3-dihydroxy-2,3-dihydrophenylpropionate dehydrogenase
MSDLHNESIFITGGGSGLGLALVERFIEEGAQVATLELSAAKVASLRQRFGEHILAVEGNVTCYADYQRAVDQILTRSGKQRRSKPASTSCLTSTYSVTCWAQKPALRR